MRCNVIWEHAGRILSMHSARQICLSPPDRDDRWFADAALSRRTRYRDEVARAPTRSYYLRAARKTVTRGLWTAGEELVGFCLREKRSH